MGDNVGTVKAIYDRFARGDIAGILGHLDPKVEWEHDWGMEPPPLYQPRRGREQVTAFFAMLQELEFLRFEPIEFLVGGNMVAVPLHLAVRHKTTGQELHDLEVHLWTFGADGLVTRMRHVLDTRQVVRLTGA